MVSPLRRRATTLRALRLFVGTGAVVVVVDLTSANIWSVMPRLRFGAVASGNALLKEVESERLDVDLPKVFT